MKVQTPGSPFKLPVFAGATFRDRAMGALLDRRFVAYCDLECCSWLQLGCLALSGSAVTLHGVSGRGAGRVFTN